MQDWLQNLNNSQAEESYGSESIESEDSEVIREEQRRMA
jgi:hypothetical protein